MEKRFLFVGIEGFELTQQDINNLLHWSVVGVLLFSRNYQNKAQLKNLCNEIHNLKNPALMIAVDHEGGRIQRFIQEFTPLPEPVSFMRDYSLGEAKKRVRDMAKISAKELAEVGIDINFSPCLDLIWYDETNGQQRSEVMNSRCFYRNPKIVAELANIYMQMHHQLGVMTSAKHFPGHGFVEADSHLTLPIDNRNQEQMKNDLLAFELALEHSAMMMVAHIKFPQLSDDVASFSPYWLKTILRKKLLYQGVIIGDDLNMKACDFLGDYDHKINIALEAGNDYLIWGNELNELTSYLQNNLSDKMINLSKINHLYTGNFRKKMSEFSKIKGQALEF